MEKPNQLKLKHMGIDTYQDFIQRHQKAMERGGGN